MSTAMSNIMLATTTMSSTRCRLYNSLAILQDRLLYCDTDSIVYSNQLRQKICHLVTCWGNSLASSHSMITSPLGFVANYSYITKNGEQCCKVGGFTLNYKNSRVINFQSMKRLLLQDPEATLYTTNSSKINRDK